MTTWLILTATLPTSPSGLRVRIWRSLKATHCATLREGVYILPATVPSAQAFWDMDKAIREAGAESHVLELQARDAEQEASFVGLFDRTDFYADFARSLKDARQSFKSATEAQTRKTLRELDAQLHDIRATDFFAAKAAQAATSAFEALRLETERRLSPGEPNAVNDAVQRLSVADFQGKTWATRARPWVDRLATAWLVRRFVDKKAHFVWLDKTQKCPKAALGFDFDGAHFSHLGERVTFEVVAASFSLDVDAGIQRLGELVHFVDVGGVPVDEAAGLERVIRGLQSLHADDDALLRAAMPVFDALYATWKAKP